MAVDIDVEIERLLAGVTLLPGVPVAFIVAERIGVESVGLADHGATIAGLVTARTGVEHVWDPALAIVQPA